jgi:uncharacterized protein (DUF2384 family)
MRNAQDPAAQQPAQQPAHAALAVFFGIAEEWSLTSDQQIVLLGSPARSTFFKWKKEGGLLSSDTQERVSHLTAIYKALNILFPNPTIANSWLRRPNKYFENCSALDVMLRGKLADIYAVRAYVDAQRGG